MDREHYKCKVRKKQAKAKATSVPTFFHKLINCSISQQQQQVFSLILVLVSFFLSLHWKLHLYYLANTVITQISTLFHHSVILFNIMINVFKPIVQRDLVPNAYYNDEILQYNGVSPKDTPILPFNQTIEDLNRDIYAKPLHSHNDYWREYPLFSALSAGAISVESDIWYFPQSYKLTRTVTPSTSKYNNNNKQGNSSVNETLIFKNDEIYVGHSQEFLKPINTLFKLYLNPLSQFLQFVNPTYEIIDGDSNSENSRLEQDFCTIPTERNSVFITILDNHFICGLISKPKLIQLMMP